ncbi:MAG: 6-carboxytetrahydropterin synthase QueD [Actinomycetota bacterium]
MYELTVSTHFDAAHSLTDYPGECARLHGHTFRVDVVVAGEALNKIGLVYDFKDLKDKTNDILGRFDHRHLNEIPPFDRTTPTAENIANYLYHEIKLRGLPANVSVKRVDVWESASARLSCSE